MFRVVAVPPAQVRAMVPHVWHLLEMACSRDCELSPADLVRDCLERAALLWVIFEDGAPVGVCVTRCERRNSDGVELVHIAVFGGEGGRRWASALQATLRDYRKQLGRAALVAHGRKGIGRMLGLPPSGRIESGHYIFEDRN